MRSDYGLISTMLTEGFIDLSTVDKLVNDPLVLSIDEFNDVNLKEMWDTAPENYYQTRNLQALLSELPLYQFNIEIYGCYISLDIEVTETMTRLKIIYFSPDVVMGSPLRPFKGVYEFSNDDDGYDILEHTNVSETALNEISDKITYRLLGISMFFDWVNEHDYYAVRKTPNKKPGRTGNLKGKKYVKVKSRTNTSIIFLNKLPSNDSNGNGGEGHTKCPHQRKGYRYTLKAERYSHHPRYQMYKAMYKKPVWIGPTVSNYKGNTYTVLKNDHRIDKDEHNDE